MSAATEVELVIDWMGRPHTSNDERRKHWRALSRIHAAWRSAGQQAALIHKLRAMPPCVVTVQARYKGGRVTDPDGCAPSVKCVLDGLVDRGVWPDDTGEWVRSITYLPPLVDRSKPDALIVRVRSLDAEEQGA
jgi:hypothetical protein